MASSKVKLIGVLRAREEVGNSNNKAVVAGVDSGISGVAAGAGATDAGDGGGGVGGDGANGGGAGRTAAGISRPPPKMSALDVAGILNCRRRMEWTKEWLKKNQKEFLSKENLLKEIQFRRNETYYLNYFFDITERQFHHLVTKLAPVISSFEPHRRKKSFSAEERIAITLKYLATGEYHSCRNYCFRASKTVIHKMISDICLNMYELLKDQFLAIPKTDEQWQNVANELQRQHRLPNCLGVLSMRQMKFHKSPRTDEEPDFVTKVPLIFTAIVDGYNNFMYVDVERTTAKAHDRIFEHSSVKNAIENKKLLLPETVEQQHAQSYYFVGTCSMPAKPYLLNSLFEVPDMLEMKGASNTTAYKYSCAVDTISTHMENALHMLSNIFPILAQPLRMEEDNARKIILGCVALYNFLRLSDTTYYKRTEQIHTHSDKDTAEEDDDCILVSSDEDQHDDMPNVIRTNCFQNLHKQRGDTTAGSTKRKCLLQLISEAKLLQ